MASKAFSIEAIFSAKDRLSAPIAKISGRLAGLGKFGGKALGGMNRAVDAGIKGLGKFADVAGIAGVVSLGALAVQMADVVTQGAELEKTLVKTGSAFETPIKLGTEGFARLTAAARKVGQTTEFTAQQGAEGLNSLATAGYDVDQSIAALPKVIDFASAASLDLGQASDIASDSLGAFSLRTADAEQNTRNMGRVMDTLTRAAADSTTNVAELFEGVRMGGAFAKTAGAELETFAALQGVLANKGVKGAEAGTAIRNSYLHLTKQTKEAHDAQAKLGVVTAKNKDGSIDMITTIDRFSKATSKLNKTQKAQAIATIFGAYTVGPFLALMDSGADTIRKFEANLKGATGITEEMAATARESTAAKIQMFFNTINDVKLTVFDAIAPTILEIAKATGDWVAANRELIGTKAAEYATDLKEALPEIVVWTERIAKALAGFLIISAIVKVITVAITVVEALATAFAWVEFAALLVGVSVGVAIGWILLIAAAVAGVVALLYAYWPEISAFFVKLKDWAIEAIGSMWEWIKGAFEKAKGFVVAAFEFIVGIATLIWGPHIAAVKWFIGQIGDFIKSGVDLFVTAFGGMGEAIGAIWDSLKDKFVEAFMIWTQWDKIKIAASAAFEWIAAAYNQYVAPIIEKAGAFVSGVVATVRAIGRGTLGTEPKPGEAPGAPGAPVPQVVSPAERTGQATADATGAGPRVDGTITVETKPGTAATAKSAPRSVPLVVQPSGAW